MKFRHNAYAFANTNASKAPYMVEQSHLSGNSSSICTVRNCVFFLFIKRISTTWTHPHLADPSQKKLFSHKLACALLITIKIPSTYAYGTATVYAKTRMARKRRRALDPYLFPRVSVIFFGSALFSRLSRPQHSRRRFEIKGRKSSSVSRRRRGKKS